MRSISHAPETATFPRHPSPTALVALLVLGFAGVIPARAATPPGTVNYQGVLRNALDVPFTGTTVEMIFRFLDSPAAGNEIMVDQHTIASGNGISISNGLFNVALGSGTVVDGSGPGTYTSLDAVFRDYGSVWLEVVINSETLSPRTQIQSAPYSLNSAGLGGHPDDYFINTSSATQEKHGRLTLTSDTLGLFAQSFDTTIVAHSSNGMAVNAESAHPLSTAGRFKGGVSGSGLTGIGGNYGLIGNGEIGGGYFFSGVGLGIRATGGTYGGYFDTWGAGTTGVLALGAVEGIRATGNDFGGYFQSNNLHGVYATGPDHGVDGDGGNYGGYFEAFNADSYGVAAFGVHTGVFGKGQARGAYFTNFDGDYAYLADAFGYGIFAHGTDYGGHFDAASTTNWAEIAVSTWKVRGVGVNSFVQNHPADPDKVVIYVSPEGDEAAVYTRGSGRLVNGQARVRLGETFALVANPDIGLTATVTPRGEPIPLAVSEVSPGEIVVRGPAGSDTEFDYMVWGLRIGFEEMSVIAPKQQEAKIPSMYEHERFFKDEPALHNYTALARFKESEEKVRGRKSVDFSRADRLRDAVGVAPYRPGKDLANDPGRPAAMPPAPAVGGPISSEVSRPAAPVQGGGPAIFEGADGSGEGAYPAAAGVTLGGPAGVLPAGLDLFTEGGVIEAGDVVSLAPDAPGSVVRSVGPGDPLVIGCAQPAGTVLAAKQQAAVITSHIALCRADASFGAIAVGDRLTASPSPGAAMKADLGTGGTALVGRAIDPLPIGSGLIRVLLGGR